MANLKLIYFKMRALAEAPQLMLHYGTPYSYEMAWDYFGQPWSEVKSSVLYRQLPLLVVNESSEIFQSGAITRFLAALTGLKPDDALLLAEVDALYEASQELFTPLKPTINFAVGEKFLSMRSSLIEQLTPRLEDFERILGSQPTTPFFFGETPFYSDFGVFHHVNLALHLDDYLLDPYPFLSEFISNIERLDGVKEYLENRPELIGVGSEPKLVIDGVARSTGTVNE
jgi:glutathione S-transferase